MDLVLMGPPGVGKGTQAARIRDRFGLVHVSTGDVLRRQVADRTPLGEAAHAYMSRGGLVPDELVTEMCLELVLAHDREGVLLDGFPRTLPQALALDAALTGHRRRVDAVLWLSAPDELLVLRLTGRRTCADCRAGYHLLEHPPAVPGVCDACGGELVRRADDDEDTARTRLAGYAATAAPVLAHYRRAGVVRQLEGTGTVDEVGELIEDALADLGPAEDWSRAV